MTSARIIEGIRCRWASFDTLSQLIPRDLIRLFLWLGVVVILQSCYCYSNGISNELLEASTASIPLPIHSVFKGVNITAGYGAMLYMLLISFAVSVISRIYFHIANMVYAVYVFIAEHKKIIKMPLWKKALYTLTWFMFDAIGRWTLYAALFMKVEWKPIPHTSKITIQDIDRDIKHNIPNSIVEHK